MMIFTAFERWWTQKRETSYQNENQRGWHSPYPHCMQLIHTVILNAFGESSLQRASHWRAGCIRCSHAAIWAAIATRIWRHAWCCILTRRQLLDGRQHFAVLKVQQLFTVKQQHPYPSSSSQITTKATHSAVYNPSICSGIWQIISTVTAEIKCIGYVRVNNTYSRITREKKPSFDWTDFNLYGSRNATQLVQIAHSLIVSLVVFVFCHSKVCAFVSSVFFSTEAT